MTKVNITEFIPFWKPQKERIKDVYLYKTKYGIYNPYLMYNIWPFGGVNYN